MRKLARMAGPRTASRVSPRSARKGIGASIMSGGWSYVAQSGCREQSQ